MPELSAAAATLPPPWVAMAGVMTVAAVLLALVLAADRTFRLHAEVVRKLVHLVTGTLSATFPWIFADAWPVVLLAIVSTLGMVALRLVPRWLHLIKKAGFHRTLRLDSLGDITFPVSIAGMFALAHTQPVRYVVPLLVATYGDAAAAVIGKKFGRNKFRPPFGGTKSLEGSLAFFLVAYLCFAIPLGMNAGDLSFPLAVISLGGALLTMGLEAIAWSGLDNLFLPFGAWLYLLIVLP